MKAPMLRASLSIVLASVSLLPVAARADNLEPRVVDAYKLDYETKPAQMSEADYKENRGKAGLNEIVIVKVARLQALLDRAHCLVPDTAVPMGKRQLPSAECRPQEILLYLDGRSIPGLKPESGAPDPESGTLRYHLRRTEESEEHWADLLGLDIRNFSVSPHVAKLSVGLADEYPIPSDVEQFRLVRIRPIHAGIWLVTTIVILIALWHLARKSDVLRAREVVVERDQRKPYSLGQSQAAVWFILTIVSFVFIWAVTGQHDNLPTQVLVLLGIGFGTALGAQVIDKGKQPADAAAQADLARLLTEKAGLENALSGRTGQPIDRPAVEKQLQDTVAAIKTKYPGTVGLGSKRFDLDIMSDGEGVSFHRFQMVVWTLVLGLIFLESVISRLAMPHFNETLLTLMGISAGTYLGFKIPEQKTPPAAPAGTATTPPKKD